MGGGGFGSMLLSGASIIGGLIFLYLILSHPDAITSMIKAGGGFVTSESKILQGR